jgi:hypothetical protein
MSWPASRLGWPLAVLAVGYAGHRMDWPWTLMVIGWSGHVLGRPWASVVMGWGDHGLCWQRSVLSVVRAAHGLAMGLVGQWLPMG